MSQKHDRGWQKRHQPARPRTGKVEGGRLARDLVNRGLADPIILEGTSFPTRRGNK